MEKEITKYYEMFTPQNQSQENSMEILRHISYYQIMM